MFSYIQIICFYIFATSAIFALGFGVSHLCLTIENDYQPRYRKVARIFFSIRTMLELITITSICFAMSLHCNYCYRQGFTEGDLHGRSAQNVAYAQGQHERDKANDIVSSLTMRFQLSEEIIRNLSQRIKELEERGF